MRPSSFQAPEPGSASTPQLCVAFDLDDTLYLEREYVHSGCAAVGAWIAEQFGLKGFGDRAWTLFESGARKDVWQNTLAEFGLSAGHELLARILAVYREHRPDISLLPDAANGLAGLKGQAVLGIITDGRPDAQRAKCERLGIDKLVDFILCTAEWGQDWRKPDPRSFKLAEQLSRTSRQFVYIGDNPLKDFQAPMALGWETVWVRRENGLYTNLEPEPELKPTVVVPDLSTLPTILAAMASR